MQTPTKYQAFIYEHCPFCVRVALIVRLKCMQSEVNFIPLLNDDEAAHIKLCGSKQVPILVTRGEEKAMVESLDIVAKLDSDPQFQSSPLLTPASTDPKFEPLQKWSPQGKLTHWRFPRLGFAEFATQGAIDYFTKKKSLNLGDFFELEKQSDALQSAEEAKLRDLEPLFPDPASLKPDCGLNGKSWSYDDITVFPRLRCLSAVKGFAFPPRAEASMKHVSECAKLPLWTNIAI